MFESTGLLPLLLSTSMEDQEPNKNRFLSDTSRPFFNPSSRFTRDPLISSFSAPLLLLPRFNQLHEAKYRTGHQKSEAIASEQTSGSSCRQVFDSTARVVDRRCYTLVRSASASASACPSSPRPKLQLHGPLYLSLLLVKKFTVTSPFSLRPFFHYPHGQRPPVIG